MSSDCRVTSLSPRHVSQCVNLSHNIFRVFSLQFTPFNICRLTKYFLSVQNFSIIQKLIIFKELLKELKYHYCHTGLIIYLITSELLSSSCQFHMISYASKKVKKQSCLVISMPYNQDENFDSKIYSSSITQPRAGDASK